MSANVIQEDAIIRLLQFDLGLALGDLLVIKEGKVHEKESIALGKPQQSPAWVTNGLKAHRHIQREEMIVVFGNQSIYDIITTTNKGLQRESKSQGVVFKAT